MEKSHWIPIGNHHGIQVMGPQFGCFHLKTPMGWPRGKLNATCNCSVHLPQATQKIDPEKIYIYFLCLCFTIFLQFASGWCVSPEKASDRVKQATHTGDRGALSIWCCLVKRSMTLLPPVALNAREASKHLASLDTNKIIANQRCAKLTEPTHFTHTLL